MKPVLSWSNLAAGLLISLASAGVIAAPTAPAKPLHSFAGPDGHTPSTALLRASDGLWYGTTSLGGANHQGTVYRVGTDGSFTVLHDFNVQGGGKDAEQVSALSEGPDHAFYGSMAPGNQRHSGILFRITAAGQYTELHQFGGFGSGDGRLPSGPPVPGPDGNFYGATRSGGAHGLGAVYRMTPDGVVTVLHSFDGTDGVTPDGAPVVSPAGEVFGTTTWGPGGGYGLVYRMGLAGEGYTALHAWPKNRKEGVFPTGLVLAPTGDLYGVAVGLVSGPNRNFQGLVFKLTAAGDFSIVHGFRDGAKAGTQPNAHLVLDDTGQLYGATYTGGSAGGGTVYRIGLDDHLSVLADLGGAVTSPQRPVAGAAPAPDGSVWLNTTLGGRHHQGRWGAIVRVGAP